MITTVIKHTLIMSSVLFSSIYIPSSLLLKELFIITLFAFFVGKISGGYVDTYVTLKILIAY